MAQRDARGRFRPAGAPGSRRPQGGARSDLGEHFAVALAEDFAAHGARVIEALRAERPADYLKLVLALQPKEAKTEGSAEDLSDDELDRRIERLAAALGLDIQSSGGDDGRPPASPVTPAATDAGGVP